MPIPSRRQVPRVPRPSAAALAAALCAFQGTPAAAYDGTVDDRGMLPFVVELQMEDKGTCTGVAVNPSTIVTAAHCFVRFDTKWVKVVTGYGRFVTRDFALHPDFPRDKRVTDPLCECWRDNAERDIAVVRVPGLLKAPFASLPVGLLPEETRQELVRTGTMRWGMLRYLIRPRMEDAFGDDGIKAVVAGFGVRAECELGSKAGGCVLDGKRRWGTAVITKGCLGDVWCITDRRIHGGDSGGPLLVRTGAEHLLFGVVRGGKTRGGLNASLASTFRNAPFLRAQGAL